MSANRSATVDAKPPSGAELPLGVADIWINRSASAGGKPASGERLFDAEFEGGFCGAFADLDFVVAAMGEHSGE
jgi:hypothetical protein